jgi:putative ABC transport system substrate-binding protein
MRRREFIAGLGSAAAWPMVARAQQPERVRRIGVLTPVDENDPGGKAFVSAFTQALADLG